MEGLGEIGATGLAGDFRYWAFISYSHADKRWAEWLHKKLENYRIPRQLVGQDSRDGPLPKRLYPVFRDREELPASTDLGGNVKNSLRQSRYLIVICSRAAVRSAWVNEEIRFFQSLGRDQRIFCLIVSGEPNAKPDDEPNECLPGSLRSRSHEIGVLAPDRTLHLAADVRPTKDSRENAKLRILAGLLNVKFDELKQREKRRKLQWRIGLTTAFFIFTGMIAGTWQWQEHRKAEVARLGNIESSTEQGRQELLAGSPLRALPFLVEAYREGGTGAGLRLLLAQAINAIDSQVVSFGGPSDGVHYATYSPDGNRLLTASANNDAKVWDAATGKLLLILPDACERMFRPVFSPDGSLIATARGKITRLWQATDGKMLWSLNGHKLDIKTAAFSSDSKRIITASVDDTARIWDTSDGRLLVSLVGHSATVRSALFSPDGQRVLTISSDGTAKVWNAATGEPVISIPLGSDGVKQTPNLTQHDCFSPDSSRILTLYGNQVASVWDAGNGKRLASLKLDKPGLFSAMFRPDTGGVIAFSTTNDNRINVWDVQSEKVVLTLAGHKGWLNAIDMNPSGTCFVTASWDTTARVWDALTGTELSIIEGHKGFLVESATFSPDGKRLVTIDGNGYGRIWDTTGRRMLASLGSGTNHRNTLAFSSDGLRIAAENEDYSISILDVTTGEKTGALTNSPYPITAAVFSRDGNRLITASGFGPNPNNYDPNARVWDISTRRLLFSLGPHSNAITAVQINSDGSRILTATANRDAVHAWDLATGMLVGSFVVPGRKGMEAFRSEISSSKMLVATYGRAGSGALVFGNDDIVEIWECGTKRRLSNFSSPNAFFYSMVFNHDGSRILTASADHNVTSWDTSTGKAVISLHANIPFGDLVRWHPGGSLILTTDANRAKIWDASTGRLLTTLEGHPSRITFAEFTRDGSRVATADADGVTKIWDLHLETRSPQALVRLLEIGSPWRLADGQLTPARNDHH